MLGCLIQIDGYDPVAAAAVTLYASSVDDTAVCHLNGQTWWPAISQLPALRYDLFSGQFDGKIGTPGSSIGLAIEPSPNFARYSLADARVRLWTGNVGDAWGSWTQRFDGRATGQARIDQGIATLPIAVDDRWLDTPVLSTYAGTGGAEGPAALKGTPKPLALGAPRYAPAVLIDPTNTVLQISAYGLIEDVETALERLASFGSSTGDYPSYAALVAATIPAGRWATAKAVGMVRHGAPPIGRLSYQVKGDKAGPDGWARNPGQLIRRIALLAGGAGRIDDASLDALDVARPWNLSIMVTQQTTARELIQKIAASVNAVAGVSWLGKLFVAPIAVAGSAVATLQADGSALPPVASVEQIEVGPPWWRLDMEAERTWSVHSFAEVAFGVTLTDRGIYNSGTTYREGDVVNLDDGSRYRYVNPTAAAGNAPPDVTYWTVMSTATIVVWGTSIAGAGKPADNATRNVVTYSASAPSFPVNGDLWADISGTYAIFKLRSGGAWVTGANALSAYNALSGKPVALADINTTESSKLAGIEGGANVTGTHTAAAIAGQGALATLNQVNTAHVVANAVTDSSNIATAAGSTVSSNGAYADGLSASITFAAGAVPILGGGTIEAFCTASGGGLTALRLYARLLRDSTIIRPEWLVGEESVNSNGTPSGFKLYPIGFSVIDLDVPSAGSHTYKIQFKTEALNGLGTVSSSFIINDAALLPMLLKNG